MKNMLLLIAKTVLTVTFYIKGMYFFLKKEYVYVYPKIILLLKFSKLLLLLLGTFSKPTHTSF